MSNMLIFFTHALNHNPHLGHYNIILIIFLIVSFILTSPPPTTATYLVALPSDLLPIYSVTQLSHVKLGSRTNLCLQVLIGWFYTVLSHWCKRTLPSTDPRSDHLVTLLHLLRKCRKILQNIKSGLVILIILLVINFPNKSPNKKNEENLVIGSVWISGSFY